jgi:DNA-binding transcriptional ArsR family regulator
MGERDRTGGEERPTGRDGGNERIDGRLSVTALGEILSEEPRRELLATLIKRPDGRASVEELADALNGSDGGAVVLHHVHLPKLEAHDVVEYDGNHVRYRKTPQLEAWLDLGNEQER